jgi:hypothetical protein
MQRKYMISWLIDSLLFGNRPRPNTPDPMGDGSGNANPFGSKGKGRAPQNGDILAMDLVTAEEGTATEGAGGNAFMQMQLVEQQARRRTCHFFCLFTPMTGGLHTIAVDRYRVHRIDNRRARANIHATRSNGRGAARNGTKN